MATNLEVTPPSREQLVHVLYEAAELEHTLMCTYLYAAFSLRSGEAEGLSAREADAVAGWRRVIINVAVEEMGHLTAVWNITAALGGAPRFGRGNFPLDPGNLPAGIVVKLAPFSEAVIQHFVHLERPSDFERARRRRLRAGDALSTRRRQRSAHADGARLRHGGRVLRDAGREAEGVRQPRGRRRGVLRRPAAAALRRRGRAGAAPSP